MYIMVEEMHQEARNLKSDAPPLQQIIYLFKLIHNNNKNINRGPIRVTIMSTA